MKKLTTTGCLIAITLAFAASAAQSAPCADRDYVVSQLQERFGETLSHVSMNNDKNALEVYSSSETERWTITLTIPQRGLTCMVATGKGYSDLQAGLKTKLVLAKN